MIAVDDWNALYWRTAYHEWLNNKHRRRVDAADVRLVAALRRLMEGPPPPPPDEGVAPCVRLLAAMWVSPVLRSTACCSCTVCC